MSSRPFFDAFGAFIDIGVHQDGLAHVSQLADRFIKDLDQAVEVHQKVMATVLEVDVKRKGISLSLKKNPEPQGRHERQSKPQQKPKTDLNALQQAFMKHRT